MARKPADQSLAGTPADPAAAFARLQGALADDRMHGWVTAFTGTTLPDGGLRLAPKPGESGRVAFVRTRLPWLGAELSKALGRTVPVSLPEGPASAAERVQGVMPGGLAKEQVLAVPLVRDAMAAFPDAVLRSAWPWRPEEAPARPADSGDNAAPPAAERPPEGDD